MKQAFKSLNLPKPIADYFGADKSDGDAVSQCFTANAVVTDEGHAHEGSAALAATDKEIDQAGTVSLVQDIENRNDVEKQATARSEQQRAEMVETFGNYRTNFTLITQPPLFQEGNP